MPFELELLLLLRLAQLSNAHSELLFEVADVLLLFGVGAFLVLIELVIEGGGVLRLQFHSFEGFFDFGDLPRLAHSFKFISHVYNLLAVFASGFTDFDSVDGLDVGQVLSDLIIQAHVDRDWILL